MSAVLIEKNLVFQERIIDPDCTEGRAIHAFLLSRAKKLAGKYIDFDKTPVTFLLSEREDPNAFFTPISRFKDLPKQNEKRSSHVIFTPNPYETPVICVTKGLIDLVDNLDQLDYVLGHELTHLILNGYGTRSNSKGEEELSDLHAIDLVYDAGGDPKQVLRLLDKIWEYHDNKPKQKDGPNASEKGINWSEVFAPYLTNANRRSAIEASLTRLSHLIDDRTPTALDKTLFDAQYNDPIETLLAETGYQNKEPLKKLEALIDMVDIFSEDAEDEASIRAKIDALSYGSPEGFVPEDEQKILKLRERKIREYKEYFSGKVMVAKYKQKIVQLAEEIFEDIYHQQMKSAEATDELDTMPALLYLQNKAYAHIKNHGYPDERAMNYHDASSMLYSFFYGFLFDKIPYELALDYEGQNHSNNLLMVQDILAAKTKLKDAKDAATFIAADAEMTAVYDTIINIRSLSFGDNSRGNKMDNLSLLSKEGNHRANARTYELNTLYNHEEKKSGQKAAWDTLTTIAKSDESTTERITELLKKNGIHDYRITHDLPYVRLNNHTYNIDENGTISEGAIKDYEFSFALNRDKVLTVYDYVKSYLDKEDDDIDQLCNNLLNIKGSDFDRRISPERTNEYTDGQEWIYDLISIHNTLPNPGQEDEDYKSREAKYSIAYTYRRKNPYPNIKDELLHYENPIFQEHFGDQFQASVKARKQAKEQKIFETALKTIETLAELWQPVAAEHKVAKRKADKFLGKRRSYNLPEEDKEIYFKLDNEAEILRHKEKYISDAIFQLTKSALENSHQDSNLNRLTSDQRRQITELIVKDEKGLFYQILTRGRYEEFCNRLNVLSNQSERVLKGNFKYTPMMESVAKNIGYKTADSVEKIKAFIDHSEKKSSTIGPYHRYLNALDLIVHLSQSSDIDHSLLTRSFMKILKSGAEYEGISFKLMTHNKVLKLIAGALQNKKGYADLSFEENMKTANDLMAFKRYMNVFIGEKKKDESDPYKAIDWDYKLTKTQKYIKRTQLTLTLKFQAAARSVGYLTAEEKIEKRDTAFRTLLNGNIDTLLKRAEQQILDIDDPLAKIKTLHWFYKTEDGNEDYQIRNAGRISHLEDLNKREGNLKAIEQLSIQDNFWPKDPLKHIQAFILAKKTFIDDIELEDKTLNTLLDKIEELPAGKKKNKCLRLLLGKELRASHPETRQRLFDIYTKETFEKLGHDDSTKKYQNKLAVQIKAIENSNISAADKYILLRQISDAIISQEKTSKMFKKSCQISLNPDDLMDSYLYGIGLDALTSDLDHNPKNANQFIHFLNSKGEMSDCETMSLHLQNDIKERQKSKAPDHQDSPKALASKLEKVSPARCKFLYDNFWAAPLEVRAVITARVLKSAARNQQEGSQESWEAAFDVVMNSIIHPDDTSIEARYAQDIMHSYIKSRSDYERELILSAMMVASRNIGKDAGNVGKALKLFLENMGPAEIKLGQAIASYPSTPESIRRELQDLKNAADIPARWTLYDWIKNENIPEKFWKNKYLGKILGSASYYTTIELGDDDVLRLLRPEAREKAKKGFKVINATVEDLQEKDQTSALDYKDLTTSITEMVKQAAKMSTIETDHDKGQTQYEYAQEIYNGITIHSGSDTFSLKVMDWNAKGKNWTILKKAEGYVFNDLPETTPEEIRYKKNFAKGYITFELMNVLSGKKFDHDKHGAQLCINPETNEVGIFDTGAMALKNPTGAEQKLLGNVIYDVIKASMYRKKSFAAFSNAITKKIDELHDQNIDTQYLVEVKKGILALGDFFKVLDNNDIQDIMPGIDMLSQLSDSVQQGIYEKMSTAEKAQLKVFSATRAFAKNKTVSIQKDDKPVIISNVANVTIPPSSPDKSSWFSETLTPSNNGEKPAGPQDYNQLTAAL